MSLSQIDMFASQPELGREEVSKKGPEVSSSCPPRNFSKWLLFFEWDEEKQTPFEIFQTTHFGSEIKDSWVKSTLSSKAREKKLTLNGKKMSLFGKFDPSKSGRKKKLLRCYIKCPVSLVSSTDMTAAHRKIVKEAMNYEFVSIIQSDVSIPEAYKKMIGQTPYSLITSVSNKRTENK